MTTEIKEALDLKDEFDHRPLREVIDDLKVSEPAKDVLMDIALSVREIYVEERREADAQIEKLEAQVASLLDMVQTYSEFDAVLRMHHVDDEYYGDHWATGCKRCAAEEKLGLRNMHFGGYTIAENRELQVEWAVREDRKQLLAELDAAFLVDGLISSDPTEVLRSVLQRIRERASTPVAITP